MSKASIHCLHLFFSGPSQMKNRGTEEINAELKSWWWAPQPCRPPCPALRKFVATFGSQFLICFLAHYKVSLELCTVHLGIIKTNKMNLWQKLCNYAIWYVAMTITLHRKKQKWLRKYKGYKRPLLVWHELHKISQKRERWGTRGPKFSTTCSSCSRCWIGQQVNSESLMTFDWLGPKG